MSLQRCDDHANPPSLHHPPARQHHKPRDVIGAFDDLQDEPALLGETMNAGHHLKFETPSIDGEKGPARAACE
jgi:hypothetical protein